MRMDFASKAQTAFYYCFASTTQKIIRNMRMDFATKAQTAFHDCFAEGYRLQFKPKLLAVCAISLAIQTEVVSLLLHNIACNPSRSC